MWAVYSGEVRGEVVTKSRMCYVGWAVWIHGGSAIYASYMFNMITVL